MNVHDAEQAIAKILSEFEKSNDAWVIGVDIDDIEITNLDSRQKEYARRPVIEFKPRPGSDWDWKEPE